MQAKTTNYRLVSLDEMIRGSADVINSILGELDTGSIRIDGEVRAKVIIALDHIIDLRSWVHAITVNVCNLRLKQQNGATVDEIFLDGIHYSDVDRIWEYMQRDMEFLRPELLSREKT